MELVSKLAYPLPVRISPELLGVPPEDHSRFAGWWAKLAHSVQPSFGAPDPDVVAEAEQAGLEFAEYFTELIAVRRSRVADDLLTKLIKAEDADDRLTVGEMIATRVLLLVAGHETTIGLISNAMLALLRNSGQLAALAHPDLAASAVQETLRYDPPVQLTGRVASRGITIDGVEPREGAVLLLLLAATGRDPAVFADADVFRHHARRQGAPCLRRRAALLPGRAGCQARGDDRAARDRESGRQSRAGRVIFGLQAELQCAWPRTDGGAVRRDQAAGSQLSCWPDIHGCD
jgi:cytochrome P450